MLNLCLNADNLIDFNLNDDIVYVSFTGTVSFLEYFKSKGQIKNIITIHIDIDEVIVFMKQNFLFYLRYQNQTRIKNPQNRTLILTFDNLNQLKISSKLYIILINFIKYAHKCI